MHKSLDKFEFQRDPATDYGVNCPWASEKSMLIVVNTLAPSFLFFVLFCFYCGLTSR